MAATATSKLSPKKNDIAMVVVGGHHKKRKFGWWFWVRNWWICVAGDIRVPARR